jgi:hypothetical protein
MTTFNLIRWQDEAAAELMAYYAMGRRGNFQIRLIRKRLAKELERVGFATPDAIINDVCDYAALLVECKIPNHGAGWAARL